MALLAPCPAGRAAPGPASGDRARIQAVRSWGVQLQGHRGAPLDVEALAAAPFDLLVIDPTGGGQALTRAEIERIRSRPGGARTVLAYLSIGEAEDYRPYFRPAWRQRPPAFLTEENPEWKGNYKVRYWDPAWQALVLAQLEQILAAGFDGVYLDIIDAYEHFGPEGPRPERPTAAADMTAFVCSIARRAREVRPGALIVPQNGAEILDHVPPEEARRYLAHIDGIGAEDTFFFGRRKEDNPQRVQQAALAALLRFRAAGKVVLALEYLRDRKKLRAFRDLAARHGFVPYAGPRALDRLSVQ